MATYEPILDEVLVHTHPGDDITGGTVGGAVPVRAVNFSTNSSLPVSVGQIAWNTNEGTLDIGLAGNTIKLPIGQKQVLRVVNKTGSNLLRSDYKVVRARRVSEGGAQGQRIAVKLAQGNDELGSNDILGVVGEDIANNQEGFIVVTGEVGTIDTTGQNGETWSDGDVLYLSPSTAGGLTNVEPQAPDHLVVIGYVSYSQQNNGKIVVAIRNSWELGELHNVRIASASLATNQLLAYMPYNASISLWQNTNAANLSLTISPTFNPANTSSVNLIYSAPTLSATVNPSGIPHNSLASLQGGTIDEFFHLSGSLASIASRQANASLSGFLSFQDWYNFSNLISFPTLPLVVADTTTLDLTFSGTTLSGVVLPQGIPHNSLASLQGGAVNEYWHLSGSLASIASRQANGSLSGFLSGADWTTFNAKQQAITVANTSSVNLSLSGATLTATVLGAGIVHGSLASLLLDDHTQYALLAGRSGGQTLTGGTASGDDLTLSSTANAAKGNIFFGTSTYDEVNNRLGIGITLPTVTIHAVGSAFTAIRVQTTADNNYVQNDIIVPTRRYSFGVGGASVTDGVANEFYVYDGTAGAYRSVIDSSGRYGLGTVTPSFDLAFGNTANKTLGIETTSANTIGRTLTISAGDSGSGVSLAGGPLVLESGVGTGVATSNVILLTGQVAANASTTQVATERVRINNEGQVLIGASSSPSSFPRLHIIASVIASISGVRVLQNNQFYVQPFEGSVTGDYRTYNLDAVAFGSFSAFSLGAVYGNSYNQLGLGSQLTINQSSFVGTNRMTGDGGSINSQTYRAQGLWGASAGGSVTSYSNFYSVAWSIGANASPKIGRAHGIYLEGLNASYATLTYGVYQAGANDDNYFAGFVGYGSQTNPRGPIDVVSATPSVFQRNNAAIAGIHSYYNANITNNNGLNWTFYSDSTGTSGTSLTNFGQWDVRFDDHVHSTRSSTNLFRNFVNGSSNIWLWAGSNGKVGINTATGPTDDFTVNGTVRVSKDTSFNEYTTTPGMYLAFLGTDNPRAMFANGTASQNWQIDNSGGAFRFYLPGYEMMRLTKAAGSNSGIITLYNEGSPHFSAEPSYLLFGNQANYDIQFISPTAAGTPGKNLTITANDTTSGVGSNNTAGGSLILNAGVGTGTGSSNFIVKTGQTVGVATTGQTITTRLTIDNAGLWTLWDGTTINLGTTTGTKIGTATTQKLAFYNSTPIVQRSGAAQNTLATNASLGQAVSLINELRLSLVNLGLIKGVA